MCIHDLDNDNNYTHYEVNHLIIFVDPKTGVQKSEGICKSFFCYEIRNYHFTHYLAQYSFRDYMIMINELINELMLY